MLVIIIKTDFKTLQMHFLGVEFNHDLLQVLSYKIIHPIDHMLHFVLVFDQEQNESCW